nr:CoA-binding protein [Pseudomonadota bacterium]
MTIRNLDRLLAPAAVAVVGGGPTADGPDAAVIHNLTNGGFAGPVMPVHPQRQAVQGVLAYRDIAALPVTPDLAVIARPLGEAPGLIRELGERGCRAVVLLTDEVLDDAGPGQAILDAARPFLLRVLGPDGLGLAVPGHGLNASVGNTPLLAGRIGFVSESAAILRAAADWAGRHHIGFSHLLSVGAKLDVDLGDLLDYLARDSHAKAIFLYLETVRHARKFMSAARAAARIKPVIVLKPRNCHADPEDDPVYDAAFRRAGLLRVEAIEELFSAMETLATARPVAGSRLAIVGNSRSIGLLAGDSLSRAGGTLAQLAPATRDGLAGLVPAGFAADNPLALGVHAGPGDYARALDLLARDSGADGVLVVHAPTAADNDSRCAQAVAEHAGQRAVFTAWLGGNLTEPARRLFKERRVPGYSSPDAAVAAFMTLACHHHNQQLLLQTPPSVPEAFTPDAAAARRIVQAALA